MKNEILISTLLLTLVLAIFAMAAETNLQANVIVTEAIPIPDLSVYYTLDSIQSGKVLDSSGNNNDGNVYQAILNGGINKSALWFDGNNDYVKVYPTNNFPSDEITASFWMRSSDIWRTGTPISYAVSGSDNEFTIYNYKNFEIFIKGKRAYTGVSANDAGWHHIAVSWKSSSGETKLYKDGVLAWNGVLAQGNIIQGNGAFVLAQEQDSVGGGFNPTQAFSGLMDEVKVWSRVLSAEEIKQEYEKNTLNAFYKFENNVLDETGNNLGVNYGATFTSGKKGMAASFDGVNDYISVADNNSLDVNDAVSISAWIKADSFINQYPRLVAKSGAYDFYLDSGRKLWMAVYNRYGARKSVKGSTTLSPNTWYYVTGIYHKDTGFKLYVNGVEESLSGNIDARGYIKINTQNLIIANWPGSVRYFDGLIDELKIWNRALTQDEITEEYKANTLAAYYKFENNVLDETGNNPGVNYGASFSAGKIGLAANFDGVNDYVNVPDSNSLDMSDALTISAWINANSFANSYSRIIAKNNAYDLYLDASTKKLQFAVYTSGGRKNVKSNTILSPNIWYHVVAVYNKDAGFKLYINGVEESLTGDTGARGSIVTNNYNLLIGNFEGLTRFFSGKIDELKIWNRALSPSEILAEYSV